MRKRLVGRIRDSKEETADSASESIEFGPPLLGQFWLLDRVYYDAGATITRLNVYVGQRVRFNIVDTSTSIVNVADNAKPIFVPEQHLLIFRFTGLTIGEKPIVNIQGRIFEHVFTDEPSMQSGADARPQPVGFDVVIPTDEKAQRELTDNRLARRQGR